MYRKWDLCITRHLLPYIEHSVIPIIALLVLSLIFYILYICFGTTSYILSGIILGAYVNSLFHNNHSVILNIKHPELGEPLKPYQTPLPPELEAPLQLLISKLTQHYINGWYKHVSEDPSFIREVQSTIEYIMRQFYAYVSSQESSHIIYELLKNAISTTTLVLSDLNHFRSKKIPLTEFALRYPESAVSKLLDQASIERTLRAQASAMIVKFSRPEDSACLPLHCLLREVLAMQVFKRITTHCSSPRFVNRCIILYFSSSEDKSDCLAKKNYVNKCLMAKALKDYPVHTNIDPDAGKLSFDDAFYEAHIELHYQFLKEASLNTLIKDKKMLKFIITVRPVHLHVSPWVVYRRYRGFKTLYYLLKKQSARNGRAVPSFPVWRGNTYEKFREELYFFIEALLHDSHFATNVDVRKFFAKSMRSHPLVDDIYNGFDVDKKHQSSSVPTLPNLTNISRVLSNKTSKSAKPKRSERTGLLSHQSTLAPEPLSQQRDSFELCTTGYRDTGSCTSDDEDSIHEPYRPASTQPTENPPAMPDHNGSPTTEQPKPNAFELKEERLKEIISGGFALVDELCSLNSKLWFFRKSVLTIMKTTVLHGPGRFSAQVERMLKNQIYDKLSNTQLVGDLLTSLILNVWPDEKKAMESHSTRAHRRSTESKISFDSEADSLFEEASKSVPEDPVSVFCDEESDESLRLRAEKTLVENALSENFTLMLGQSTSEESLKIIFELLQEPQFVQGFLAHLLSNALRSII